MTSKPFSNLVWFDGPLWGDRARYAFLTGPYSRFKPRVGTARIEIELDWEEDGQSITHRHIVLVHYVRRGARIVPLTMFDQLSGQQLPRAAIYVILPQLKALGKKLLNTSDQGRNPRYLPKFDHPRETWGT